MPKDNNMIGIRKYLQEKELTEHSVEDWCEKQVEWLTKLTEYTKNNQYEKGLISNYVRIGLKDYYRFNGSFPDDYLFLTLKRVPIKLDARSRILCTYSVDRFGTAVMITYILWYYAKKLGKVKLTYKDVKDLFFCCPTEEQWHEAWEEQKFIGKGGFMGNILDEERCAKSLECETEHKWLKQLLKWKKK
jgi:hypothetical protein